MRKILITNDDGITSEGLVRLAKAAKKFGKVWVIAPDSQRSATSQSITLGRSIEAWKVDFPVDDIEAYACDGKPADCVRIGVLNLVPGKPDVVLSGINFGYNLACDLQYSATAGAAFEAAFQRIPSIALSEDSSDRHEVTEQYLEEIIEQLLEKPLTGNRIWNVNFPGVALTECKGILWDRKLSDDKLYTDRYLETEVSPGRIAYTIQGTLNDVASEGTDMRAIMDGYISIGVVNNIS